MNKIRVVIDPGHGGEDRWNRGPTGYIEADGVLKISKYLKEELENTGGFEVKLTRETDKTLSRKQRGEIARDFNADLFISEHTNAFNGTAKGTEVFYSVERPKDLEFARKISAAIATNFQTHNRGAKTRAATTGNDYYGILFYGVLYKIPTVLLIESLFHDNVREEGILLKEKNLREIAKIQGEMIKSHYQVTNEKEKKEEEVAVENLYRVQVGAFRYKENALRMMDALENDGYPTYLIPPK